MVRCAPLNTPVMHPVQIRLHHFYVPNRIVWDGWEDFITGGPEGDDPEAMPLVDPPIRDNDVQTYLGVPYIEGNTNQVSALALRGFNKIFNEYYADQDLFAGRGEEQQDLPRIAWGKDYFTTARPWTQKGPDVTIPIAEEIPIRTNLQQPTFNEIGSGDNLGGLILDNSSGDDRGLDVENSTGGPPSQVRFGAETGLVADGTLAQGVNVNAFREAFAIQRYQEARARYGSRFTEYLRYLGIRPSDARLQRPEYLGGGSQRLQFSEVLQTTPSDDPEQAGVGDLYGHGIAGVRTPSFRKFFEEHGYVYTLCSVRPSSMYLDGIPREFLKRTKEDFYQRELVHLGQQEVDAREVNFGDDEGVFGYQDRYDEYRTQWSQVGQDFKSTLSSWHLGRDIPPGQALNADFIRCNPSDRIFQVQSGDNLWVMANHKVVARRLLPKRAKPRIL